MTSNLEEVGKGLFIWSGQLIKERPNWVPIADVRKDIEVCKPCGKTVDYAWIGEIDEEGFQEKLAELRDRIAEQECGEHTLRR